jgi:subtilisin-like proprotein convertase family protein
MSMQAIGRWLGEPKKVALLLLAAGLAAVAALGLAASAASAATFSNDADITINDGSESCPSGGATTAPGTATPYPSTIAVTTFPEGSSITDVNVTVSGLSHGWPDDIGLLLVSPAGQSVILMTDSGGGFSDSGINLTFDDAASDPVPDNTALVSESTYRPSRGTSIAEGDCDAPASFPGAPMGPYGTSLSVFNGTNPNGDWKLYVIDDARLFTGSISGWSLDISTTTVPTTPTTKNDCKKGGWKALGWPDQGTCVSAVNRQN